MAIHRRHTAPGALAGCIEVIFSVVGRGTTALARVEVGLALRLIGPLGRGFEIPGEATSILLMSHGSGACAVMGVAEDALARGIPTVALLSAAMRSAVVGESDCRELGVEAIVVTEDGATRGGIANDIPLIDQVLTARFDAAPPSVIMVCGSSQLARAAVMLGRRWDVPVQVSLEAHMACGLGYCHGCAAPVATDGDREGPLVCHDGPVFDAHTSATLHDVARVAEASITTVSNAINDYPHIRPATKQREIELQRRLRSSRDREHRG
jgi:dihydroorotate dehydrogenase electron transfer subunit